MGESIVRGWNRPLPYTSDDLKIVQINELLNLHPSSKQWKLSRLSWESLHFFIRAIYQSQLNRPGQSTAVRQCKPFDAALVAVSMQILGSEIAQKFVATTTTQQYQHQPLLAELHLSCTVIAISNVHLIRSGLSIASNWPGSHTTNTR